MRLFHGSKERLKRFGGSTRSEVHLGSLEQARMRNSAFIHEVEVPDGLRFHRVRDNGEIGKTVYDRARRSGYDGVVYLNRYEGLTTEVIERLASAGRLGDDLDRISDAAFARLVPEAHDSYAVFDPGKCRIIAVHAKADMSKPASSSLEDAGFDIQEMPGEKMSTGPAGR